MFSVVPGLDDSDVISDSESDHHHTDVSLSGSKLCDDDRPNSASADSLHPPPQSSEEEHHETVNKLRLDFDENDVRSDCIPPAGISNQNWERFQSLQKRRSETKWVTDVTTCRRHRKRRRRRKKGKEQACDDQNSRTHCSDQTDDQRAKAQSDSKQAIRQKLVSDTDSKPSSDSGGSSSTQHQQEEHWNTLKKYLNVNDHMKGVDQGKYAPKSGMEKKLDEAVAAADFDQAEEISEGLSKRDLACKIAKAANARDYLAWKHEQEERREANKKKRRKLAWGFEPKERWQMKGNM